MTGLVLSPRARMDLDGIWNFGEERWGALQAERYLRDIWKIIETVAREPRLGRACDEIRPGYRKILTGSHIVFYRETDDGIDVVRVLHQRMDLERHL